jgi:hypothetical protein
MRSKPIAITLAVAGALAANAWALAPAPSLRNGETRWFFGGRLHVGDTIRCTQQGATISAKVPAAASGTGTYSHTVRAGRHVSVEIERRADGATQVTCGEGSPPARFPATLPYVIGPNGLGLIHGPNRLDSLRRVYGRPSSLQGGTGCVATWPAIGLRVELAGGACAGSSLLRRASVSGSDWSTLDGTRVGDPVPQMRWQQPGARRVAGGAWLLAVRSERLYAVATPAGRIASFRLSVPG